MVGNLTYNQSLLPAERMLLSKLGAFQMGWAASDSARHSPHPHDGGDPRADRRFVGSNSCSATLASRSIEHLIAHGQLCGFARRQGSIVAKIDTQARQESLCMEQVRAAWPWSAACQQCSRTPRQ